MRVRILSPAQKVDAVHLTRRNAVLGIGGTMASAIAAGAWFVNGPGESSSPTRGRGRWTTFGSVAVLGWSRHRHTGDTSGHGHSQHHGTEQAELIGGPHGIWPQTVVVEVEVHNGLDRPLLFSPGQFRLRVGSGGPSVTPYDAEGSAEGLPAHSTRTTWVSFLAPQDAADLAVEFTEAGASRPTSTLLRSVATDGSHASHEVPS